jgi:hypothetical protein
MRKKVLQVWKWEDSPDLVYDLFPQGLKGTHDALLKQRGGAPVEIKAHSTNWDYNSPHRNDSRFASTNYCGGQNCSDSTKTAGTFLPGVDMYSYLFEDGKKWGLSYIKQDHEGGGPAQNLGIDVGKNWYKAMGDGAAVRKTTPFWARAIFGIKVSYFPRQARDKHRKS